MLNVRFEANKVPSLPLGTEFKIKRLSVFHSQTHLRLPIYEALSFYSPALKSTLVGLKCSWAVPSTSALLRMILACPKACRVSLYCLCLPHPGVQSLATFCFPRIEPTAFHKYFEGSFLGFSLNYPPPCILKKKHRARPAGSVGVEEKLGDQ